MSANLQGGKCWRREYNRGVDIMPGAVEDCQGVYDERQRDSGKEIAAAEDRRVGRPARSTDVHSMHRNWAVDWSVDRNTLSAGTQTLGFSGSTAGATGRGGRSTDNRVWAEICCSGKLSI